MPTLRETHVHDRICICEPGHPNLAFVVFGALASSMLVSVWLVSPLVESLIVSLLFVGAVALLVMVGRRRDADLDRDGLVFVEPTRLLIRGADGRLQELVRGRIEELRIGRVDYSEKSLLIAVAANGRTIEGPVPKLTAALVDELSAWRSLSWSEYRSFRDPRLQTSAELFLRDPHALPIVQTSLWELASIAVTLAVPIGGVVAVCVSGPVVEVPFAIVGGGMVCTVLAARTVLRTRWQPWRPHLVATSDRLAWRGPGRGQPSRTVHRSQVVGVEVGVARGKSIAVRERFRSYSHEAVVLLHCRPADGQPPVPPTLPIRLGPGESAEELRRLIAAWLGEATD